MKKLIILSIIAIMSIPSIQAQDCLMPVPVGVKKTGDSFSLDRNFEISLQGNFHERLYSAADRFLRRLDGRTGIFFKQERINEDMEVSDPDLIIRIDHPGQVNIDMEESYNLLISKDKINLNAPSDIGAIRGLETLLQLLKSNEKGYFFPGIHISDTPRFKWRGLMIDVSRHWQAMEVILRNLDGMAAVKLNVLHLHLTEDQGFRIESKVFPELHQKGSEGMYFTQAEMRKIIKYADDRGIRVIPEFDIPGHATSWFLSHPELASAPGPYKLERKWGIMDPSFNPAIEETYAFFDAFFTEMSELFPDEYFHIGGDENNGKHWDKNQDIQEFMKKKGIKNNHELQSYFNQRILKILTKNNKKMVGWDEILQPEMPKNIVIQSWRGKKSLYEAASKGYQAMLSNGYYIDLIQSTDYHYLNDPLPEGTDLSKAEKDRILGGEATMWSEHVTSETIDSRIWPRMAAIAERFWSESKVKDVQDMYRRLDIISIQLEDLGLMHERNYPVMLRRLVNGRNISALQTLVDVLEPVKIYQRTAQKPIINALSPYTRVVDAARPDQKTARLFREKTERFLQNESMDLAADIKESLMLWEANHELLLPQIQSSPILFEIEDLSKNLSLLANIGLEALEMKIDHKKAEHAFLKKAKNVIEEAKKPYAQTEIMIVPAIEKIVESIK